MSGLTGTVVFTATVVVAVQFLVSVTVKIKSAAALVVKTFPAKVPAATGVLVYV
ncbi:hypothetical protein D3C87_1880230 [compost metagenome]